MKLSVARLCLVAFIVLELVLSAAILSAYRKDVAHLNTQHQSSESPASVVKTRILELTGNLRHTAAQIASHPQTLQSLASHTETERINQLANIRAFFPDAEVRLLPANNTAASGTAPLSAVHVRLLEAASRTPDGGAMAAARLMLTTVQPVIDSSNTVHGYVVIDREFPELQNTLKLALPSDDYIELQQIGPGETYSVLAQHGNESRKMGTPQEILDLPNTTWRLAAWPAAATPAAILRQNFLTAWLAASAFAAGFCTLLYFMIRRSLQGDLHTMLTLFDDIRHNRLRKSYDVQLKDVGPTFDLMYRLGKLMVGKQKEVASQVSLDHLSQVHNRRSFEAKQQELFKTLAQGWVHSLLILDIDNFKQVNDTFGHDAGDTLIVQFGKILKDNLRSSDFIARLGGDEFCVIFPNTPLKRAAELSERLRSNMPRQIELANGGVLHRLSWSGGLSEYNRHDASENMALARADAALLEAKRAGRNRTSLKAAA